MNLAESCVLLNERLHFFSPTGVYFFGMGETVAGGVTPHVSYHQVLGQFALNIVCELHKFFFSLLREFIFQYQTIMNWSDLRILLSERLQTFFS